MPVVFVALRAHNLELVAPGGLELVVGDPLDAGAERRATGRGVGRCGLRVGPRSDGPRRARAAAGGDAGSCDGEGGSRDGHGETLRGAEWGRACDATRNLRRHVSFFHPVSCVLVCVAKRKSRFLVLFVRAKSAD